MFTGKGGLSRVRDECARNCGCVMNYVMAKSLHHMHNRSFDASGPVSQGNDPTFVVGVVPNFPFSIPIEVPIEATTISLTARLACHLDQFDGLTRIISRHCMTLPQIFCSSEVFTVVSSGPHLGLVRVLSDNGAPNRPLES